MKTFVLLDTNNRSEDIISAEGCILPDGQAAIAWKGSKKTHGCYPTFEAFQKIQSKQPSREILFLEMSLDAFHFASFSLVRNEDVTGISGTGIVARGCCFYGAGIVVLQWLTEYSSTFWYPSLNVLEEIHGHGGKTKVAIDTILKSG